MWTPEKEQEADAIEADAVFEDEDQDTEEEQTEESETPKKSKKEIRIALIKQRAERLRAMKAKKAEKGEKKKPKKGGKMSKYIRGTLIKSIYAYFDEKWPDVTYDETEELAKKIKPDTKFNKYHFSWYRNDYKNRRDIP